MEQGMNVVHPTWFELLQHLAEQPVCLKHLTGVDSTYSLSKNRLLSYLYWVPGPIRQALYFGANNNCGIGLVAAIGIILRDLIGRPPVYHHVQQNVPSLQHAA